jgi:hypothetical protein
VQFAVVFDVTLSQTAYKRSTLCQPKLGKGLRGYP